jgi:L-fuculose-phosphate aldolase
MTAARWQAEKRAVVEAAREIATAGLTSGASGNVSTRLASGDSRDLMAITPSGGKLSDLSEDDIAVVDFDVEPVEGDAVPSAESLMHVAIYRARPDVGAVIHTHPVYASAAAVAGLEIPSIVDEMVVLIGGPVRVSGYAFPSTQELADNVCTALGERNAALIRNHGAVGVGSDLSEAVDVCVLTERMAKIFCYARLLGEVGDLPKEAVEAEAAIFRMRRQAGRP